MNLNKLIPFLATFLTLFGTKFSLADTTHWKTVGWWDVSFYDNMQGCSAFASYEGGTSFFIGLSGTDELYLEVLLLNSDWKSLEAGKEYDVSVKFGNEGHWNLEMNGDYSDQFGSLKLSVPANSEKAGDFVDEFMRETKMVWKYEGTSLGIFKLNGSSRAFEEVVVCTKSYRDAVRSSNDPFSSSAPDKDPFD